MPTTVGPTALLINSKKTVGLYGGEFRGVVGVSFIHKQGHSLQHRLRIAALLEPRNNRLRSSLIRGGISDCTFRNLRSD